MRHLVEFLCGICDVAVVSICRRIYVCETRAQYLDIVRANT